jgi:hypothetical protein
MALSDEIFRAMEIARHYSSDINELAVNTNYLLHFIFGNEETYNQSLKTVINGLAGGGVNSKIEESATIENSSLQKQ